MHQPICAPEAIIISFHQNIQLVDIFQFPFTEQLPYTNGTMDWVLEEIRKKMAVKVKIKAERFGLLALSL